MAPTHTSALFRRTRRTLIGSALSLVAALVSPSVTPLVAAFQPETMAGPWRTWLLTSGNELRPPTPVPPTPDELSELVELHRQRTAAALATIAPWDDPTDHPAAE
jgi:hypothetical protein